MIRKALLGTVTVNMVILVAGTATGILSARLLGPTDRGLLAAIVFWPTALAELARMGLDEALIVAWLKAQWRNSTIVVSAVALGFMCSALMGVASLVLLPVLLGPDRQEWWDFAIAFATGWIPLAVLNQLFLGLKRADFAFQAANVIRLLQIALYLVGMLVLARLGAITVQALALVMLASAAIAATFHAWSSKGKLAGVPDYAEVRGLFCSGVKFHIATVVALLTTQADRMIVISTVDDASVGYYVVAWTFAATGLGLVTNAVSFVLVPVLGAERDRSLARAKLSLALRCTALFLYAGVGASIAMTPWLLPLLFGKAFENAVSTAVLLLLAVIPLSLRQTIVQCLRAFSEARIGVTSELAALASFALACVPLAAAFGVDGIAASTIVGNSAGLAFCARHLAAKHGMSAASWLAPGPAMLRDGWSLTGRLASLKA